MMTIKQLREFLDEVEKHWNQIDVKYFGALEDQAVMMDTPNGIAHSRFYFDYEFGLVVLPEKVE